MAKNQAAGETPIYTLRSPHKRLSKGTLKITNRSLEERTPPHIVVNRSQRKFHWQGHPQPRGPWRVELVQ